MSKHSKKPDVMATTTKQPHVLIVDDEEAITEVLKRALQRMQIIVTVFNAPKEVLKSFRPNQFDLALIDVRMPGMNGFELLKRLKSIDKNLKVCLLTGFEIEKEEFSQNGLASNSVDCYMKKPILLSDFTRKVGKVLEGCTL
jgi:CheY-like chemotaxis protein